MTPRASVLAAAFIVCTLLAVPARAQGTASPNDTARVLAGMPVPADSPLAPLTRERGWQQHADLVGKAWGDLEKRQLSRIRTWSHANLAARRPVTFYFFSGPDFLYVDAFFPDSTTYVLAGLEPVGPLPDIRKLHPGTLPGEYMKLRASLRSLLNLSFFITREMDSDLRTSQLRGTLPILYVFLARAGKTVHEVDFVSVDADGTVQPDTGGKSGARGVRIVFSGPDNRRQTLYYFKTDLSNHGLGSRSGFLAFCEKLGVGDVFIKAASYLLHGPAFSRIRDFLLERGASVVQDDTGIPLRYFQQRKWGLHPFGEYVGPIPLFSGHYQRTLQALFNNAAAPPIDFGVGYRWRPNQSHVLLAVNRDAGEPVAAAEKPAVRREAPASSGIAGATGKAETSGAAREVESALTKRAVTAKRIVEAAPASPPSFLAAWRPAIDGALWFLAQTVLVVSLVWAVLFWFGDRGGLSGNRS